VNSPVLDLAHVTHRYDDTPALDDISLSVKSGECVALLGPSGAGKSTLLALIDGQILNWQGTATVLGNRLSPKRAPKREDRLATGFIFQEFALVERLSAYQNVMNGRMGRMGVFASLMGKFDERDHLAVVAALNDTGLADLAGRRADHLSGGQRQRVAIARCLAQEPQLLLADEPVSNLDPAHAETVLALITGSARKQGMTAMFSSHQPALSKRFADRIIGLRDGRIAFDLPTSQVGEEEIDWLYHGIGTRAASGGLRVVI
jgi:phosphonate transport system ATP-binding protein